MKLKSNQLAGNLEIVCSYISARFKPLKREVLFMSLNGHYSDSPKAISEKMHEMYPSEPVVWLVSKERLGELPAYVEGVDIKSKDAYVHLMTAKTIVDNTYCKKGFSTTRGSLAYYVYRAIISFVKRKGQLLLSTWHGTPLKKMGIDIEGSKDNGFINAPMIMTHGNCHVMEVMNRITFNQIDMKLLGSPRNDLLFNQEKGIKVKRKLGLTDDTKIILYAPTFRSDGNGMTLLNAKRSGIDQVNMIDFDKLFGSLNHRFGGNWVFVGRFHYFVASQVDWDTLNEKYQGRVINGNQLDDMADYLSCTDVLLTDSSSCMFDFALTGKPCFLFFPDLKEYKENERGLYFEIENLPFPCSENFDEFQANIEFFDENKYAKQVNRMLQEIGNVDDGNASERVVRFLMENQ